MDSKKIIFSDRSLMLMIIPLFLEQFLVMFVGMADTLVVSYVGEFAVSGVSLVNQINIIFIFLFTALSSGGAVVISQYIGRKTYSSACEAASQLLLLSVMVSVLIFLSVLAGNEKILDLMFGRVESSVMEVCITYLRLSAYSYPMLAVYNSGAALYRSLGKTSVTMYLSAVSNIINVIGNIIGVFVLHKGVAGVAYSSLIARTFSALIITLLCFGNKNPVHYSKNLILRWNGRLMKNILNIAVPNGLENGISQLVKVAVSSIVALFGTYQIAANGIAQSIWSMAALTGVAMGPVFITVIGQSMGSGNTESADYYFKRLSKITLLISAVWNIMVFILTPLLLKFYDLEEQTADLVIWLVLIHNVFNAVAYPFSGAFSNGLRAAGDVKFTMYISIASTVVVRLLLSYYLGVILNLGVIGISFAMVCDWIVRGTVFILRQKSGRWKEFQVI